MGILPMSITGVPPVAARLTAGTAVILMAKMAMPHQAPGFTSA
jgi:hypothetical protein